MFSPQFRRLSVIVVAVCVMGMLLILIGGSPSSSTSAPTSAPATASACAQGSQVVQVSVLYSPEVERYLGEAKTRFNKAYNAGLDPLTGAALAAEAPRICITGTSISAGLLVGRIAEAANTTNTSDPNLPTIWIPSVSHWLILTNLAAGRDVFDLLNSPPTALAPVVMAIWESRLKALQNADPGQQIGWQQLLEILKNPKGWEAYGLPGRHTVYYGHTDPNLSSTALSTLMAEYYASARYNTGFTGRRLTLTEVNNKEVQQGVLDIEKMIKHYSSRTTEFLEYIAQGPEYVDFVALEENDLIYINLGKTQYKPPANEKLVALYPSEGTFYHEHPFAIPDGAWVSPEQRKAAEKFRDYVLSQDIQQLVLTSGFRPVNPNVQIGYPFVSELGVDPTQPRTVLDLPEAKVMRAVQQSWDYVKKKADICLVIDISGSMRGDKIDNARNAALAFVDKIEQQNHICLITFNTQTTVLAKMDVVEGNQTNLKAQISGLQANGGTALYDSLLAAMQDLSKDPNTDHIRAILLLSDGQDTESKQTLRDVVAQIDASQQNDANPMLVIPICYGSDCDKLSLKTIASASKTIVQSGDPATIDKILDLIRSYF